MQDEPERLLTESVLPHIDGVTSSYMTNLNMGPEKSGSFELQSELIDKALVAKSRPKSVSRYDGPVFDKLREFPHMAIKLIAEDHQKAQLLRRNIDRIARNRAPNNPWYKRVIVGLRDGVNVVVFLKEEKKKNG